MIQRKNRNSLPAFLLLAVMAVGLVSLGACGPTAKNSFDLNVNADDFLNALREHDYGWQQYWEPFDRQTLRVQRLDVSGFSDDIAIIVATHGSQIHSLGMVTRTRSVDALAISDVMELLQPEVSSWAVADGCVGLATGSTVTREVGDLLIECEMISSSSLRVSMRSAIPSPSFLPSPKRDADPIPLAKPSEVGKGG